MVIIVTFEKIIGLFRTYGNTVSGLYTLDYVEAINYANTIALSFKSFV